MATANKILQRRPDLKEGGKLEKASVVIQEWKPGVEVGPSGKERIGLMELQEAVRWTEMIRFV